MTLLHSTFVVCGKALKLTDVKIIDSKEEFLKIVWDINRLEEVYSVLIYHAYDLLIKTNFSNSIIISFDLATVFGDPHVYTFDGKEYTFNGKGNFEVSKRMSIINLNVEIHFYFPTTNLSLDNLQLFLNR